MQLRDRAVVREAAAEVDEMLANRGEELVRPLQRAVRDTMWEHCAVVRSEAGLRQALDKLDQIEARSGALEVHPDVAGFQDLSRTFNLRSAIVAARATVACALERRETRGAHNRSDYPHADPELQVNLTYSRGGGIERSPIAATPEAIMKYARDAVELDAAGRLLE